MQFEPWIFLSGDGLERPSRRHARSSCVRRVGHLIEHRAAKPHRSWASFRKPGAALVALFATGAGFPMRRRLFDLYVGFGADHPVSPRQIGGAIAPAAPLPKLMPHQSPIANAGGTWNQKKP
jgi:hypothetical protein